MSDRDDRSKEPNDGELVRWPAERFYWSVVDARDLGTRPSPRQLGYLLESDLPLPLEAVHAVYARLDGGRHLTCAAPVAALAELRDAGAVSLSPSSVPDFVEETIDPQRLNLLTGPFASATVVRLERAGRAVALIAIVAVAALVILGLRLRADAARDAAHATEAIRRDLLVAALGEPGRRPHADMILTSELSRLRATRSAPIAELRAALPDATAALERLLAAWPSNVHLTTDSIGVRDGAVTVVGAVGSTEDAQRVADALASFADAPASGWRLDQPRFETRRDGIMVTLRFRPEAVIP